MMNEAKWQRIRYMPGTGIGEDGQRITGSENHIALSRHAAAQGMVLLKNEDHALPLNKGQRIAVFGKAQADYVKGGGGSGDVTVAYVRSILQGLQIKEEEGKVRLFAPLSSFYEEDIACQRAEGKAPGLTTEPELPEDSPIQLSSRYAAFPVRAGIVRESPLTGIFISAAKNPP